jgi:hypothetical protein
MMAIVVPAVVIVVFGIVDAGTYAWKRRPSLGEKTTRRVA